MAGTDDLGSLFGRLLGAGEGGAGGLLAALLSTLGDAGQGGGNPLLALIDSLGEGGLGEQTRSWVATGDNQPVTGAQIAQALPYQELDLVARKAGVSPEEAADQLAVAIPQAVDRLTPDGRMPQGSLEDLIQQRL
ncbi:YidB family protein [Streptomyces gamaensis]|uniref:YidB family protein n=1 Tax=Streptomyces gamaensis TaxID=1763542 RepID=A0ABW0Z6E5_9ACTN